MWGIEDKQAYLNSYKLLVGKSTYNKLSIEGGGSFILPEDHEDPIVTLKYYESIEDYEKCSKILNQIKH